MSTYDHFTGQAHLPHFLHEEQEYMGCMEQGSWNLCELLGLDSRESQGLILSKSGGLAVTGVGVGRRRLPEMRERESKKWERGIQGAGSWDGTWGILGDSLLSLSELWCSATASSETWLHRQECEPQR